ncbi:MAG: sigma 54-interacting transcriptional regulator [Thermodesulfobacteriota bacterium]
MFWAEDGFARMLEEVGAGVFLLDPAGRFVRVNTALCSRLRYAAEELKGVYAETLLHGDDAAEAGEMAAALVRGEKDRFRRQIRYIRKDGSIFWGDVLISPVRNVDGACRLLMGIVIDISRQKAAEADLKYSEDRYRRVFEKSGAASIIIEEDMTISMSNEEFEKLAGYDKGQIEHRMKWSDFIVAEDRERMKDYHRRRRLAAADVPNEYECRVVNRQGDIRDIYIKVGLLPDGRRSIASFMDITAIKQTERDLAESKAKLSAIIEAAQGYIYTCDRAYRIAFMNKAMAEKLGRDATGEFCYRALHGLLSPCPWCPAETVFEGLADRREFESPRDRRWYETIHSPIFGDNGAVEKIEALVIDITERKQAEQALEEQASYFRDENIRLKSAMKERYRFGDIIGKTPAMQQVYERILNAAATDANVIVYGESGTGKELVARAIHDAGDRSDAGFVAVNCGAIPESLLESEFFGYRKGAFTGADRDKHGFLDLADGGTLFLDELGEIGLNMQVKLLRVLEGRGYIPVGGREVRHPDIRIIAATNRDPEDLLRRGVMREDFYYRIHVLPIFLPPLRQRKADLPLLLEHFLAACSPADKPPPITGHILDAVHAYEWPGNVRELQNTVYRYVTLGRFEIMGKARKSAGPEKAGPPVPGPGEGGDLKTAVADFEKRLVLEALERARWHREAAAGALGINRRTLFKKIKQYGLDRS